jgi:hypothetical protein
VPRKYAKDPRLGSWVETQRIFWNRDYRESCPATADADHHALAHPDPEKLARAEILPESKDEEWSDEPTSLDVEDHQKGGSDHHNDDGGATVEDAALLAATMDDEDSEEEHHAAVVEDAAVMYTATDVDGAPLKDHHLNDTLVEEDSTKIPALHILLSQDRKEKLDELGFIWCLRSKRIDDHWDEMYRQVSAKEQIVIALPVGCMLKIHFAFAC